ncbi:MAG: hypothetical protein H5U36_03620 [Candidatus Caldatribacterium sp.]|nr:hypothetical protein [Candidatus Caldatribacterium sp.]
MWKRSALGGVLLGVLVFVVGVAALAQNEESVTGRILAVDLEAPATSVTIQAGEEKLVVELGPAWALQGVNLQEGDVITVVREKTSNGVLVAYSLSYRAQNGNTVTLTLRDASGKPTWSGNAYRNQNQNSPQNGNRQQGNQYQSGPRDGSGNQWGRKR